MTVCTESCVFDCSSHDITGGETVVMWSFTTWPRGRKVKGHCAPAGAGCGNVGVSHKCTKSEFRTESNPQVGRQNRLYIFKVSQVQAGALAGCPTNTLY